MDKLIIELEKECPYQVINKGELVEINPETNKYRKCKNKLSPFVIGVASDEWVEKEDEEIPYNISNDEGNYNLDTKTKVPTVNVQIAGIATVRITGIVAVGDLLISAGNGLAEAVRYKHDWVNIGRIIGKVIGVTENEDEYIVLISNM